VNIAKLPELLGRATPHRQLGDICRDLRLDLLVLIEEEFPGAELSDDAVQQIKVVGD